jgi:fructokinase
MIISCGEALIDLLPRRGKDGALVFQPFPGGSPFNVAIALARLEARAGFFGGLSRDHFGAMLHKALTDAGVDTGFAAMSDRPTTLAFANLDGGEAEYAFFDEGSAGRMLSETDLPAFPKEVTALHFGSFSLAAEPCGSAFEMLMQRDQRDCVISLDPNLRPPLIKNRDGYLARIERMTAMSDIIKLSEADHAWLAPGKPIGETARQWLQRGASLVVMTRGAAGAEAFSGAASIALPGRPVAVVDTVGAGDTVTAAILARLAELGRLSKDGLARMPKGVLADVLGFALKAAAITVSRAGADPPWLAEVTASA